MQTAPHILWLSEVDPELKEHGASIHQIATLHQAGFPLATGFVITQEAYFAFLKENNLDHKIAQLLSTAAIDRADSLMQIEAHITKLFEEAGFSEEFVEELFTFFDELGEDVIIELYTTAREEKKHLSTKAKTDDALLTAIADAWASMFMAQALMHRHAHSLDHMTTGATILVKARLPQHKSGRAITVDPKTHAKDRITIISGEHDIYHLSKKNLTILDRELKTKQTTKLTHDEVLEIGALARALEQQLYFPQEMHWAYADGELYIVSTKQISTLQETKKEAKRKLPIARGTRVTPHITTGLSKIIITEKDLANITSEHIVILAELHPKHVSKIKKAKGVITEKGHQHTEIATLLRKHAVPTIFNVTNATKLFRNNQIITIHGDKAEIYLGGF